MHPLLSHILNLPVLSSLIRDQQRRRRRQQQQQQQPCAHAVNPGPLTKPGDASAPTPSHVSSFLGSFPGSFPRGQGSFSNGSCELDAPPFEPVTVAFQDLHYFVPHPGKKGEELELLKGITGSFLPGRLTALVSHHSVGWGAWGQGEPQRISRVKGDAFMLLRHSKS